MRYSALFCFLHAGLFLAFALAFVVVIIIAVLAVEIVLIVIVFVIIGLLALRFGLLEFMVRAIAGRRHGDLEFLDLVDAANARLDRYLDVPGALEGAGSLAPLAMLALARRRGHFAGQDIGVEGIGDFHIGDLERARGVSRDLELDVVDLDGVQIVRVATNRNGDLQRRRLDLIEDRLDIGTQGEFLAAVPATDTSILSGKFRTMRSRSASLNDRIRFSVWDLPHSISMAAMALPLRWE